MTNVIELEQYRDQKSDRDEDVLEAMWMGIEKSKWGSIENLAAEVADRAPLEILKMLARHIEKD